VVEKQRAKRAPETEGVWSGGRGISLIITLFEIKIAQYGLFMFDVNKKG